MAPGQLPQPGNLNCRKDRQRRYFQQGPKVAFNSEKTIDWCFSVCCQEALCSISRAFSLLYPTCGLSVKLWVCKSFSALTRAQHELWYCQICFMQLFLHEKKMYNFMVKKKHLHACSGKKQSVGIEPQEKIFHPTPASLLPSNFGNFWAVKLYLVHVLFLCIFINYVS